MISRSTRNTVSAVAYRAGVALTCARTGQDFDYTNKAVQHVELLLPENAPKWAKDIQNLIFEDRQKGVQKFSDVVEAAEKRVDAQVYRELEVSLPKELSEAQNKALAKEFFQDQVCSLGIAVLENFHFDVCEKTGEGRPHCHTLLLTRELTKEGLSSHKNRDWNKRELIEKLREEWANYVNFHLKMHGIEGRVDHRSYAERGIDIEPQPKLGKGVQEMESRGISTEKLQEFNLVKLGNMHHLMRDPEEVFRIVTRAQSTFVWEDVQKVLFRYFDDAGAFSKIEHRLKSSRELVCIQSEDLEKGQKAVYTSATMLKQELSLVGIAESLGKRKEHFVQDNIRDRVIETHNADIKKLGFGGFSKDQIQALHHMTQSDNLSCVVGYAGAGKTTALKVLKEIYESEGYNVRGFAPTGRASRNLEEAGFKSQVIDKFLGSYSKGREQLKPKTLVVLDEAGMVDTKRFSRFLGAMETLGCKVVTVGDGAQLQAVQAGPAFRLVTKYLKPAHLETIVRQKDAWQREATQLFGQQKTREALEIYRKHGAFDFVGEKVPLAKCPETRVQTFLVSRRIAGNIWFEMLKDCGIKPGAPLSGGDWAALKAHPDRGLQKEWRVRRDGALSGIRRNVGDHVPFLEKYNVDPKLLKLSDVPAYGFDDTKPQNQCELRSHTKEALTSVWRDYRADNPQKNSIVISYSQRDADGLNGEIRQVLKEEGVIEKSEKTYTVISEERDDFEKIVEVRRARSFAVGDRLLFCKNNHGMGVSNGTLGTVLSLSKQKILVGLDEKDEGGKSREVSFAPKLYPYFDQGWATTVHKAQGTTVDRTFKLASFEENRNLSYVGMTRHKEGVQVFCSRLDFWRDEKVIDRLSGSAEKLSSLDYMKPDQLFAEMKEDEAFLSKASRKFKDLKDATTYVGGRALKDLKVQFFGLRGDDLIQPDSPEMLREFTEEERAKEKLDFAKDEVYSGVRKVEGKSQPLHARNDLSSKDSSEVLEGKPKDKSGGVKGIVGEKKPDSTSVVSSKSENSSQSGADEALKSAQAESAERLSLGKFMREEILKDFDKGLDLKRLSKDLIPGFKREEGTSLRFSGGVIVNLEKGRWYSFTEDKGGNAYSMIRDFGNAKDFKSVMKAARDYVVDGALKTRIEDYISGNYETFAQKVGHEGQGVSQISVSKPLESTQKDTKEQQEKLKDVQFLFEKSRPIGGTQGETYLRQVRGIKGETPESLRYLEAGTAYTYKGETKKIYSGAMASFARDGEENLRAVQMTYLKDGARVLDRAREKSPKRSHGLMTGSFVEIQSGKGDVYVAEGVETALSLKEAGVEGRIVAALGIHNLKNVSLEEGEKVILCADYDGKGSNTEKMMLKVQEELQEKGHDTEILWPARSGNEKLDFNDVLLKEGREGLQDKLRCEHQINLMEKMCDGPLKDKVPGGFKESVMRDAALGDTSVFEFFSQECERVFERFPDVREESQKLGYGDFFKEEIDEKTPKRSSEKDASQAHGFRDGGHSQSELSSKDQKDSEHNLAEDVRSMKELMVGPLKEYFGEKMGSDYEELAKSGHAKVVLEEFREDCQRLFEREPFLKEALKDLGYGTFLQGKESGTLERSNLPKGEEAAHKESQESDREGNSLEKRIQQIKTLDQMIDRCEKTSDQYRVQHLYEERRDKVFETFTEKDIENVSKKSEAFAERIQEHQQDKQHSKDRGMSL